MSHAERPRSVGPLRAAALLYGDWGTSKAYVLGIAFGLAGYSSFPILFAMALLTALVGLNYYWVCSLYPDGGGVYSAVRERSKMIASIGALLLLADYLVTASLSVLEGFNYLRLLLLPLLGDALPSSGILAIGLLMLLGVLNWWGPRHSGSLAVLLAVPATLAAASIAVLAIPHLGSVHFEPSTLGVGGQWKLFAGIVLALSGVEAVSNMTGVMVADPKRDANGHETVKRTSAKAIGLVATEVVVLTIILALAMHAVPGLNPENIDAMLGQLAQHYGTQYLGELGGLRYAQIVGVVMALLLFSAGNTAIIGMISVLYMMAKDREMPTQFGALNKHGVPSLPLILAVALPCILLLFVHETHALAALYAIGVVGAITINLGGCATNFSLPLKRPIRLAMGATALLMLAIWITIAVEKHEALVFAAAILIFGLFCRSLVQERRAAREEDEFQDLILSSREMPERPSGTHKGRILVCLRGMTDTFHFALEEARLRGATLGVLYIREVHTMIPQGEEIEDDPEAQRLFRAIRKSCGDEVPLDLFYRSGEQVAPIILNVARAYRAEFLVMGSPAGGPIATLLRGRFAADVATDLPPETKLLIYSWRKASKRRDKDATKEE